MAYFRRYILVTFVTKVSEHCLCTRINAKQIQCIRIILFWKCQNLRWIEHNTSGATQIWAVNQLVNLCFIQLGFLSNEDFETTSYILIYYLFLQMYITLHRNYLYIFTYRAVIKICRIRPVFMYLYYLFYLLLYFDILFIPFIQIKL